MAFTALFEEESNDQQQDLPLVRTWARSVSKAGGDPYEKPLEIRCIKLSKSGDWVIVETPCCVGLVNSKSSLGKNLEELLPTLSGEGKRLVLLPQKSGKLGFSIGVDDEHKAHYKWNAEEEYLWINRDKVPQVEEKPILTAESILLPVSPKPSGTTRSRKGDSAATSNGTESASKIALETT